MNFTGHPESRGERLFLGVEDRFLIVQLADNNAMLPGSDRAYNLASTLSKEFPDYQLVCDCRKLRDVTSDVDYLIEELSRVGTHPVFLSHKEQLSWLKGRHMSRILPVMKGEIPVRYTEVPVFPFSDDWNVPNPWGFREADSAFFEYFSLDPKDENRLRGFLPRIDAEGDETKVARTEVVQRLIVESARNSLLIHTQIFFDENQIKIVPYHGNSVYSVGTKSEVLLACPSTLARRTGSLFSAELRQFEELLNDPYLRESDLQHFLEKSRNIFGALGYGEVYSQVLLERDDGTGLRPDFLARPLGRQWFDIIDLKLPDANVAVGRRDRKTLAAAIHEMVAQLREYAAYFENEVWAQRIEANFGIRCYRPRLVGIVGRNPSGASSNRQIRRMMTAYADVDIVTFDQLLEIAQTRLLI